MAKEGKVLARIDANNYELKEKVAQSGGNGNTITPRFLANEGVRVIEYSNQVGNNAIKQFVYFIQDEAKFP